MKKFILLILITSSFTTYSQNMSIQKLDSIFKAATDNLESKNSRWSFVINEVPFMAIADSTHNRMRIISPITEAIKLNEELKTAALMANFHTALDIKYTISNDILWSAYIHPLKELSEEQVIDALSQVYYGNVNFGTTFSSTSLVFPGRKPESSPVHKKEEKTKILDKI